MLRIPAWGDALIINDTPQDLEYEPSTSLEFARELSPSPPQLIDPQELAPPVPLRDNAFLTHGPAGELAIDVPELDRADVEFKKRRSKKFEAQRFAPPTSEEVVDQGRIGVRILRHTIQQSIVEKNEDSLRSGPTASKGWSGAVSANLPGFQTFGRKNQLQVQVRASDAAAALNYRGIADASVSYRTERRETGFELKRHVLFGVDLIYNYINSPLEDKQLVKLSWNF